MATFWWLFGYVPFWVWPVAVFVIVGVLYFYFAPIINAILAVTPTWVKVAVAGVVTVVLAIFYGRYQGAKTEREIQKKRETKAVETRSKINADIANTTDAELHKRASRWMRD